MAFFSFGGCGVTNDSIWEWKVEGRVRWFDRHRINDALPLAQGERTKAGGGGGGGGAGGGGGGGGGGERGALRLGGREKKAPEQGISLQHRLWLSGIGDLRERDGVVHSAGMLVRSRCRRVLRDRKAVDSHPGGELRAWNCQKKGTSLSHHVPTSEGGKRIPIYDERSGSRTTI